MQNKIDSTIFRQVLGCFATGIGVVTAQNEELGSFGLTINSLSSVSLDPPLVLFCLDKSAHLYKPFRGAKYFSINLLAQNQEKISRHFADRRHNAPPKNMWEEPIGESPILKGTLGWVLCRSYAHYKGGDHTIFVGEVVNLALRSKTKEPLLYFRGRYREVAELGVPSGKVTSGARK